MKDGSKGFAKIAAIKAETRRRWLRGAAIDKMPKVEVHVVQSPEAPTGVGERRSGWAAALPGGLTSGRG